MVAVEGGRGRANALDRAAETAMSTTPATHQSVSEVPAREYDHVDGGTLVYNVHTEVREHLGREVKTGRQLLGFANVTDWDKIRSELARRGHGVGAIHQLPVFEGGL